MIYLPLSIDEARYLCDIIELWVEEYDSIVKPDIMLDHTLDSPEDMLKAYGSATDDIANGKEIKSRLLAMLPPLE
jgi:hypothetical protein